MELPDTKYAMSDGLHIAYQAFGSGSPIVLVPPLASNVELTWEHELHRRVLEYDAQHGRIVMFDKRGIGSSDRFDRAPTLDERISDISAVMDAEGLERASLVGLSEGGVMAQLFAARHPDRVERLALINTSAGIGAVPHLAEYAAAGDPPVDFEYMLAQFQRLIDSWGTDPSFMTDWMMPSQRHNSSFIHWAGKFQRQTASPTDIARQIESLVSLDTFPVLPEITAPTVVMHVKGDRVINVANGRLLADRIPGARYMEVEGEDHFLWFMPHWRSFLDPLFEFITGRPPTGGSRRFAAVLFTDLVGSTSRTIRAGDAEWRGTIESHDRICRDVTAAYGGRVVKSTGDGMLALFDGPSQAVGAASEIVVRLGAIELAARAGVHAGELEVREDGDVAGTAVNIAARVEQLAGEGEVYVSSAVRDMLLGGEYRFEEAGEHELKGFEGTWRLYLLDR
ncbi:MAG TPA: adenylate/guanylate cyclase domain-containing protein [Acidimicrobiales bacterium]|nr:adenylate/guanylate cyclase domain-containing protein [Acidimicrobiales bacterium]